MDRALRWLFFVLLVRPLVLVLIGLNVRHRERLPHTGPAVIVANHNSHLDTLVLMTLLPLRLLDRLRPVAAADYFLRNRWLAWFATRIVGIVPIARSVRRDADPLAGCTAALARGEILILFPEGSRGEPERLARFKSGVAHLIERCPAAPVTPVFLHGLGRAMPKGEGLLVPFLCDAFVGEPLYWRGERHTLMSDLEQRMGALAAEGKFPVWD